MSQFAREEARLIPVPEKNNPDRETRATSALLAVMKIVPEFGQALSKPLGAPASKLATYVEVSYKVGIRTVRPDGQIEATRGQRAWTALVEVKTGNNPLKAEQIHNYLDVAHDQSFDVVLTISNEVAPIAGTHPTRVDAGRLQGVRLEHLSWAEILMTAQRIVDEKAISDPEQAWILSELVRYLQHPNSGVLNSSDMGQCWVSVRNSASTGLERDPDDLEVLDVAHQWDALIRNTSFQLSRQIGTQARPVISRAESSNPSMRLNTVARRLAKFHLLDGEIKIEGAAANVMVALEFATGNLQFSARFSDLPLRGGSLKRIEWLLAQLADAPRATTVEPTIKHARGRAPAIRLGDAMTNPGLLDPGAGRELSALTAHRVIPIGPMRKIGRHRLAEIVEKGLVGFYREVVAPVPPRTPTRKR